MSNDYKSILLQDEKPSNKWLFKDTNKEVIRSISPDVELPLSEENEIVMKKLIDFVRWSQNDTINSKTNGDYLRPAVGLAAPQIGSNTNMFFARFDWEGEDKAEEFAIINPKIIATSPQIVYLDGGEGCLSVDKDKKGFVPRSYKIEVVAYDWLTQKDIKLTLRGYHAVVFQHEIEHNQGKLYYDRINKEEPHYKEEDWMSI